MTNEEYAAIIRAMIEHENSLLHHRMTWMWTIQGLLIAAVGFMWNIHLLLVLLICAVGLISCISIGTSLSSATHAIENLLRHWQKRLDDDGNHTGPPVIGAPDASSSVSAALKPWTLMPWAMALVWILLGVAKYLL